MSRKRCFFTKKSDEVISPSESIFHNKTFGSNKPNARRDEIKNKIIDMLL